jgi:hypothetical protein
MAGNVSPNDAGTRSDGLLAALMPSNSLALSAPEDHGGSEHDRRGVVGMPRLDQATHFSHSMLEDLDIPAQVILRCGVQAC